MLEWVERAVALGAGEVLLTSVDHEGTRKGFDTELIRAVSARVNVPLIASGGYSGGGIALFALLTGTGEALAAGSLGLPDLGISNLDDVLTDIRRITDVCDLPLLVDVDTGFGSSAFNVARTTRNLIKAGGAAMHMFGLGWDHQAKPPSSDQMVKDTAHLMHAAIEAFTPARCMFESNFPVDKMGCSYATLWNAFKHLAAGASASEKADLFADTARRVYRL